VSVTTEDKTFKGFRSLGDGLDWSGRLAALGDGAVVEDGVRIFHPENVRLGAAAYVGHAAMINGYHEGHVTIGDGTWIGQFSLLHGAAGLDIGRAVAIAPRVTVLTSGHDMSQVDIPPLHGELAFEPVRIEDGAYIGTGATVLPGVTIGERAVVGAGSVVTEDVPRLTIVVGCPAKATKQR
jgi:acetyltransferase-like isoleucine patch superfamily enzyme